MKNLRSKNIKDLSKISKKVGPRSIYIIIKFYKMNELEILVEILKKSKFIFTC